MMYWYLVQDKTNSSQLLVDFFMKEKETVAFVPKTEKWLSVKSIKDYVVKELYPNYIFIKSKLNEEEFMEKYKHFFLNVQETFSLVKQGNKYVMETREQELYEKLFNGKEIITHSIGNIEESKLKIEQGPLKGLEEYVIKIDRHKRIAILNVGIFNQSIKVPVEIKNKS